MSMKAIVVLPTDGAPYIWKNTLYDLDGEHGLEDFAREIDTVVREYAGPGHAVEIDPNTMRIHSTFDNRWRLADDLRKQKGVELYINEYGGDPNFACVRLKRAYPSGSLYISKTPYFGRIALVVPEKLFYGLAIFHKDYDQTVSLFKSLSLVRIHDYYAEMGLASKPIEHTDKGYQNNIDGYLYKPHNNEEICDEEICKVKAFVEANGWDLDSNGQIYLQKTGRSDQQTLADFETSEDFNVHYTDLLGEFYPYDDYEEFMDNDLCSDDDYEDKDPFESSDDESSDEQKE